MTADQPADVLDDLIGKLVQHRYRVEARIGSGGVATVFRATHVTLERPVVLKVLHPGHDIRQAQMFVREATLMTRLEHRNIVWVFDQGETECGLHFMAMQFLEGHSLAKETGRPLPSARAARIVADTLHGLVYAHSKGIVHRDLKPDNLFVSADEDGREIVKILDFGIAKVMEPGREQQDGPVTLSGLLSGTPMYMAPEQIIGSAIDQRADLYSAGVILYELLQGAPPWDADDPFVLLKLQLNEEIPDLPASVGALADIVKRLCAKERSHRYASAEQALVDVEGYLREAGGEARASPTVPSAVAADDGGPPIVEDVSADDSRRPRRRLLAAAGGLLALVVVGTIAAFAIGAPDPAVDGSPESARTSEVHATESAAAREQAAASPTTRSFAAAPAARPDVSSAAVEVRGNEAADADAAAPGAPPGGSEVAAARGESPRTTARRGRRSAAGATSTPAPSEPIASAPPAPAPEVVAAPSREEPRAPSTSGEILKPGAAEGEGDGALLHSRERARPAESLMPSR